MRLSREDDQPKIEGRDKRCVAEDRLPCCRLVADEILPLKDGQSNESKKSPEVEVQEEILEVVIPWFYAVEIWALRAEYVVPYDVPWNDGDTAVKE